MKEKKSNIGTWILSSTGATAIALSVVLMFPIYSFAEMGSATATCDNGVEVTCNGTNCTATDGVGCACSSKGELTSVMSCLQVR